MIVKYDGKYLEIREADGRDMMWPNFEGRQTKFTNGKRFFTIRLPEEVAKDLEDDGWKIKWKPIEKDSEELEPRLQINVNFNYKPLQIFMLANNTKTKLDEESVREIDYAEIIEFEGIVKAFRKPDLFDGVSASLDTLWVTIRQSDLYEKYGQYRDSGNGTYYKIEE